MTIKEWITKNATLKDTAKPDELEKLIADLDPLKALQTPDEAKAFILRNDLFRRALDSEVTARVESHDAKFQKEKLPTILKEREDAIRAELNPAETPEQKRIKELEEKANALERRTKQSELEKQLRDRAKEIGADISKAERYVVYGDDALKVMEKDHEENKTFIQTQLDKQIKEKFGSTPPPATGDKEVNQMKRGEFEKLPAKEQIEFIKSGGRPVD